MKFKGLAIFCLTILILPLASFAEEEDSVEGKEDKIELTKDDIRFVLAAQNYLNTITTLKADFVQINPNSSIASGEVYIQKPGKMMIRYQRPMSLDYFINGTDVIQYDHDLDQVGRAEAPENPLQILLYHDIMFLNNKLLNVTGVGDEDDSFSVFMVAAKDEIEEISGLVLKFSKLPMRLVSIRRYDSKAKLTDMSFPSLEVNQELDESIFEFKRAEKKYPGGR